jgi:P27 family predicted phage terminase small subunit
LLRGNPSKRAIKPSATLPIAPTCPEAPPFLTGYAADEWAEVAPKLHAAGLLAETDTGLLAVYCSSYGRWRTAAEALKTEPLVVTGATGNPIPNPLVSIARAAAADMITAGALFGLSPRDRSKVSPAEPPRSNKFAGLIAGDD